MYIKKYELYMKNKWSLVRGMKTVDRHEFLRNLQINIYCVWWDERIDVVQVSHETYVICTHNQLAAPTIHGIFLKR